MVEEITLRKENMELRRQVWELVASKVVTTVKEDQS